MFTKLLRAAGYKNFAAKKTSKQQFLIDLQTKTSEIHTVTAALSQLDPALDQNLFGSTEHFNDNSNPSECFIAADEFNEFFENDILKFVATLADLWDYEGEYSSVFKNSAPVYVWNPTISLLGGNTPTMFNHAFPVDIIGQGFFSRMFLIYAEPTGNKITFPKSPSDEEKNEILQLLTRIRNKAVGDMELSHKARLLLDKIYKTWPGLDDVRFDSYANRRFTHLLKLCLIHCATNYTNVLDERTVIYANTVLSYAEHFMPKALGEFGKAKNSEVVHKITQILDTSILPMKLQDIWKHVSNDLDSTMELGKVLGNLVAAEKIIPSQHGFLLKRKMIAEGADSLVDWSLLTQEEQERIG